MRQSTKVRLLLGLALLGALALPGGVGAGAATKPSPVSGEFVGAIPNADPDAPEGAAANELVAVVVNDPGPRGARFIRAYVCDSDSTSAGDAEWFKGRITGNTFKLRSASGKARIRGKLTEAAATGTVRLSDGRALKFRAVAARAGGGFYEVFFLPGQQLGGVSPSGNAYTARFTNEEVNGDVKTRTVEGSIQTLDSKTFPFTLQNVVNNDDGTDLGVSLIVLNKSANQAGRSFEIKKGRPSNFTWREVDS
jgi:hypothetical protein